MTKHDLIKKVSSLTGESIVATEKTVNTLLMTLSETIKEEGSFTFLGFGTFKVKEYGEREIKHVKTGETVKVKPRKNVKFTVGKNLKTLING